MQITPTSLSGLFVIDQTLQEDDRGFFSRRYCAKRFREFDLNTEWQQINDSGNTRRGTLRGLHFQRTPYTEIKLVRCVRGAIWDVAVDLRQDSRTFGKWFGMKISEINRSMLYIPKGFAHGYVTLEDDSEVMYMVSDPYERSAEEILRWSDPDVAIHWPLRPKFISQKDSSGSYLYQLQPIAVDRG
jgi:dTDP-4-dehydrorhamnose 3,5-epimerase